jgi:hypothetical protein
MELFTEFVCLQNNEMLVSTREGTSTLKSPLVQIKVNPRRGYEASNRPALPGSP